MKKLIYLFFISLLTQVVYALEYDHGIQTNEFGFIQNDVDNESFVTPPAKLDPRFSGANKMVRYPIAGYPQYSLGYMGANVMYAYFNGVDNYYFDLWLDNADLLDIKRPFAGNRCLGGVGECSSAPGLQTPEYIDNEGVYKMRVKSGGGETAYMRPVFSENMYEYMRTWKTGQMKALTYKFCSIKDDPKYAYDPRWGKKCKDIQPSSNSDVEKKMGTVSLHVTKVAHLILKSTNALQELFVDSNGNVSIGQGAQLCSLYAVGSVNGVSCRMIDYDLYSSFNNFNSFNMMLNINGAKLPSALTDEIKFGDGTTANWKNWNVYSRVNTVFKSGSNNGVYVLFTQSYLKKLVNAGIDLSNTKDAFTFSFNNVAIVPQSGFYEFTPSNNIIIRPRDYGIGIVSKDMTIHPVSKGKIGDKEPIRFDYTVTVSGPRNADEVTAQVTSKTPPYRQDGLNYCVFTSKDQRLKVPFSSYLEYKNAQGQKVRKRSACGDPLPIYLQQEGASASQNAAWRQEPWSNNPQWGSFYSTDLSLIFPMDEKISTATIDTKEDWIGSVNGQGEVTVKAIWRNVTP